MTSHLRASKGVLSSKAAERTHAQPATAAACDPCASAVCERLFARARATHARRERPAQIFGWRAVTGTGPSLPFVGLLASAFAIELVKPAHAPPAFHGKLLPSGSHSHDASAEGCVAARRRTARLAADLREQALHSCTRRTRLQSGASCHAGQ